MVGRLRVPWRRWHQRKDSLARCIDGEVRQDAGVCQGVRRPGSRLARRERFAARPCSSRPSPGCHRSGTAAPPAASDGVGSSTPTGPASRSRSCSSQNHPVQEVTFPERATVQLELEELVNCEAERDHRYGFPHAISRAPSEQASCFGATHAEARGGGGSRASPTNDGMTRVQRWKRS